MSYVTPEQIAQAKEIDLLTYLQQCQPQELVRVGGNTYCTREHDSLKISNGKWNWFSRGIGGRTALDYLIKVQGFSFTQAVEALAGASRPYVPQAPPKEPEPKKLLLPKPGEHADRAISYLLRRGIDHGLIDYCIETGRLYESQNYHNVVFVGRDLKGAPRYAALRGTLGDYKGEAAGSDKHYTFSIAENPNSPTVHLFESAIDLLSYVTLLIMKGRDWRQGAFLSLAGVFKQKRQGVVPIALSQYLQDHPGTGTLYLHLDNDEVGRDAAAGIMESLGDRYTVLDKPPPYGKDVNEMLQKVLERYRQSAERTR